MSADRPSQYFERSTSWALDEQEKSEAALRTTKVVAGAAVLIAVLEAFALLLLMPLKSTQVTPILVDRQTGFVEVLKPNGRKDIQPNAALTQALLAQYVVAREGFDIAQLPYDYQKVSLWSAGPARQDYLASVAASNPLSPLHALPRSAVVDVQIKSISPLGPNTALLRFRTTRRDQPGTPVIFHDWAAVVAYHFSDAPMTFEDRLSNPLGFQVTRYHRDAETLSPPDPIMSGASPAIAAPAPTPLPLVTPTPTSPPTPSQLQLSPGYPTSNAAPSLSPPVGALAMRPHHP